MTRQPSNLCKATNTIPKALPSHLVYLLLFKRDEHQWQGCGLGEGLEPALQGLITYLVDSDKTVRLFTTLAVCDTIAEFVGGPVTARLMEIGRRPGHTSDGYCSLGSSVRRNPFF